MDGEKRSHTLAYPWPTELDNVSIDVEFHFPGLITEIRYTGLHCTMSSFFSSCSPFKLRLLEETPNIGVNPDRGRCLLLHSRNLVLTQHVTGH